MARLEEMLDMVRKNQDVRQNLIQIHQKIADESLRRSFMYMLGGDFSVFTKLLCHEDPKVRKNAALILGMTEDEDVLEDIIEAWKNEDTLFVRESYLKAVSMLDYRDFIPLFKERVSTLETMLSDTNTDQNVPGDEKTGPDENESASAFEDRSGEGLWNNDKHLLSELSMLRSMINRYERPSRHHFIRWNPAPDLILMTNRLHADITAGQIRSGTVNTMRGSVHVKGGNIKELMDIRTWTELLFTIPGARPIAGDERAIAQRLRDLKTGNYLRYLHEESDQPFRYRIELKSVSIPKEKRGDFIRRTASRLDALEKGTMINSESGYEAELRLIERKDRSFVPMLKLYTIADRRFSYRKKVTAQSTSAQLSALAVRLALPYLKEDAQILDPFCGSASLLIERIFAAKPGPVYGVDRFPEAIEAARTNASAADKKIYFINRDFFDFTHEYPFDEIITQLPSADDGRPEELAEAFLRKSSGLLADSAVVTVLTDAPRELEEAASNTDGFSEVNSFLLNERAGTSEIILRYERK